MKKKRLRIAIIDADHAVNIQNDEYAALPSFEMAKLLARSGHKVTMFCANHTRTKYGTTEKVAMHNLGITTPFAWINRISFFLFLPFAIKKLRGDVILEYFSGGISLQITPLITNIPVVGVPKIFSSEIPERGFGAILYPVERLRLRIYRYIIAYTKDIETVMQQINPRATIRHIPLGISKEYLLLKQQKPEYILFLGKFNKEKKGLDLLLQSYAKICKKVSYPLMLAGHGKDEMKIKKLVNQLKLEKRVILSGPTYGDKKQVVLAKALFLAYPVRFDDVPVVAMEAIAAGLPVISFDIPELSWTEESFSLKAIPYDQRDYARLLRYAAENSDIELMRKEARQFAKKFAQERILKKYEAYLYEVTKILTADIKKI